MFRNVLCIVLQLLPTSISRTSVLFFSKLKHHLVLCPQPLATTVLLALSMTIVGRASEVKASACNVGDLASIPGSGRSPGEGNGNPLQYSCLEKPMDRGAWWATVRRVAKSRTRLSNFTFTFHFHISGIIQQCPIWLGIVSSGISSDFFSDVRFYFLNSLTLDAIPLFVCFKLEDKHFTVFSWFLPHISMNHMGP